MMIEYGLWDQVRTDKGKEWVLGLFVQEQLASHRTNTSRAPHLQTTSKQASFIIYIYIYNQHTVQNIILHYITMVFCNLHCIRLD